MDKNIRPQLACDMDECLQEIEPAKAVLFASCAAALAEESY